MNQSFSLRRLLSHRLFQVALLGLPATSLLLGACTQEPGGGGTAGGATSSSVSSSAGSGGAASQSASASSGTPSSGTGYFVWIGESCFPWPDTGATGAGGMGGGAPGAGGGGGSTELSCPTPDMAPASWGLSPPHDGIFAGGPLPPKNDEMCCYSIAQFHDG